MGAREVVPHHTCMMVLNVFILEKDGVPDHSFVQWLLLNEGWIHMIHWLWRTSSSIQNLFFDKSSLEIFAHLFIHYIHVHLKGIQN